jgi:heme-degrading monooxygenase HmoA
MNLFAETPKPPYYPVIFTSGRTAEMEGYPDISERMVNLAKQQDGFLGIEYARENLGITVSYWRNLESIKKWKLNTEHLIAQKNGKAFWYKKYKTRICLVERDYEFK